MLIPEPVEAVLNFPWHATKAVASASLWPVRAVLGTDIMPPTRSPQGNEATVYDVAKPMIDISSLIYYYTELRSATNARLDDFRKERKLTKDQVDAVRNAIELTRTTLADVRGLKQPEQPDAATFDSANYQKSLKRVLDKYQESLEQLERKKEEHGLNDGDVEVLTTYFDILAEPKDAVRIKSDLRLYNEFIDPAFRLSFGGSEWNEEKIIEIVDRDPTMYVKEIDDDFVGRSIASPGEFFNELNSELVYAIFVSPAQGKVTVAFRGSVNANDWMANTHKLGKMTDLKLPGFTSEEAEPHRKIYGRAHEGFGNYLFEKTQKGPNGSYKSKSEEIMGVLENLFKKGGELERKFPQQKFSLYVTGHSLGGAMSTMFAFRAALDGEFGMVTNVSFASPYCGDQGFRDAFYELEKANKIRHIRFANEEDVVPLIPFVAPDVWNISTPPLEMFKHTGMNVRLYNPHHLLRPKCRLFYPKMGSWVNETRNAVLNNFPMGLSIGVVSKHLCPEYSDRLDGAEEELKKITVESLYERPELTGWDYTRP